MKSVLITQTEAHFHLATLQCTHTYAHTLTHTLTHTCMTSPVSQKLKTLSTSAWTRCGSSWLNANVSRLLYCHSCVCEWQCVQVLLLLCMQANGMRCLRFVSVSANKEKLPTSQIEASARPLTLSQACLSVACRSPASLCALLWQRHLIYAARQTSRGQV